MSQSRTKLIATIGPASQSVATLTAMIRSGMDAARLNFSHGTHASHRRLIQNIRRASRLAKRNVVILADLQGPKIRLGTLSKPLLGKRGDRLTVPVTFPELWKHLKKGQKLLLDDGRVEAEYRSGKRGAITMVLLSSGEISSHVGLAAPGAKFTGVPALTLKDKEDALFAIEAGADWLVQSFVTKPSDIVLLRRVIKAQAKKGSVPALMAKIERAEAVKNAKKLIAAADAVMIGRGDLGLDIPPEDVPLAQKKLVRLCRAAGKPVVVATHMLESMIHNPRPTRAEISDIANAVIDHTDAVMLSGETAKGAYPLEAVQMMERTIRETEASEYDDVPPGRAPRRASAEEAFAFMIAELAYAGRIQRLAVQLRDEQIVFALSRYRPQVPVLLLSDDAKALRRELVRWAVEPVKIPASLHDASPDMLAKFLHTARQVSHGSTVTVVGYRGKEPFFTTVKV